MRALTTANLFLVGTLVAVANASIDNFLPLRYQLGTQPSITTKPLQTGQSVTLDFDNNPVVTLDYGHEVAGFPYFQISDVNNPVQIEVKYTEQFDGLNHVWADGPYYFANGLSNSFRVETFNITETGKFESYFVQGGQRWQSITILSKGHITLTEVGFVPTIDHVDLDNLPSTFTCSNPTYNEIWKLGANAAAAACFDAKSQPSTWEVTEEGAYIRGQKPGPGVSGMDWTDYTMTFSSKIVRGGTGWSISQAVSGTGLLLLLVSNLPDETTFVNTNKTLTPPNSIVVASGYGLVNQTTLDSQLVGKFPVSVDIKEGEWYKISTTLLSGSQLSIDIDGNSVLNISLADYGVSALSAGGWGFGPYQDQIALFTDVTVHASNGTLLYKNDMKSPSILSEYGVRQNTKALCMDGAKRDRLVWLGDFFHTSKILTSSTSRWDYVQGTLNYLLDTQLPSGLVNIAPSMGYNTSSMKEVLYLYSGLYDYQILGVLSFTGFFLRSGDLTWAQGIWPSIQKQISWLLGEIDSHTNLVGFGGFLGDANGTAISAALVQALNEAAIVANALDDAKSTQKYLDTAAKLSKAINEHLWNDDLGVYVRSTSSDTSYGVADIAFAISSGVASGERAASSLARIADLKLVPGYKDLSTTNSSSADISPNTNGFLLAAAMEANETTIAKYLLDNLWTAMTVDKYSSGASWEYVAQDLSPGLSLFTSLSHPWGGAPTYVLTEHVAGIRAVTPGHKTWIIEPAISGFDLDWAAASVKSQYGQLSVKWELGNKVLKVNVTAPRGTSGKLSLPSDLQIKAIKLNGHKVTSGHNIPLQSGSSIVTIQLG
ncbi:glycoside [Penicillium brasilianum]|uniref:Glycoside n=1 Tax=Penicillium brasilianum TaxID=104259 RepID=A0A1S9RH46_PENBI|nr:glycoside [Penicillium brasilianum]